MANLRPDGAFIPPPPPTHYINASIYFYLKLLILYEERSRRSKDLRSELGIELGTFRTEDRALTDFAKRIFIQGISTRTCFEKEAIGNSPHACVPQTIKVHHQDSFRNFDSELRSEFPRQYG